jgi:replication factor C subunit 1
MELAEDAAVAAASSPPASKKTKLSSLNWKQLEASITPGCLQDITFVFTGILESISRDRITELIKIAGGRVTTAVSSKTNYVVLGSVLEDSRPVQEGIKYQRAMELANTATTTKKGPQLLHNDTQLYQFIQRQSQQQQQHAASSSSTSTAVVSTYTQPSKPTALPPPVQNPYARKSNPTRNPYASAAATIQTNANNPYARKMTNNNNKDDDDDDRKPSAKMTSTTSASSLLWVDKYKPQHSREILGNQDAVRKLAVWLQTWEDTFLHHHNKKKKPTSYAAPNGPWKAALLSGPPGIGSKKKCPVQKK